MRRKDIFPALVKEANVGGHFIGMPAWTNTEMILYRKDLFGDAGTRPRSRPSTVTTSRAPTTWQQYRCRRFFTKELYGTDVKGEVETEWLAHVLQAGSPMVLDANSTVVDRQRRAPGGADFYASLTKYALRPVPPRSTGQPRRTCSTRARPR